MKSRTKAPKVCRLLPRLRVMSGEKIALGPGKIELLRYLAETQSINEAAKRMDMSYMKAWLLIQTMNECFTEPLVITARGGQAGGGTTLTETGHSVLALYREMEQACQQATQSAWLELQTKLRV